MSTHAKTHWIVTVLVGASLVLPAADAFGENWLQRKARQAREALEKTVPGGQKQQPQQPQQVEQAPQGNVLQDGVNAAVLCGGIAAVTGGSKENIAISSVGCGAINATITHLGNKGKKKYAEDYQRITDEMVETQNQLTALESQEAQNHATVSNIQKDINQLIAKEKDDKKFIAEAKVLRKDLDKQMRTVKVASTSADARIQIVDQQIADLDVIIADSPELDDLQNTKTALLAQRNTLVDRVKTANSMNDELVATKSQLDDEIIGRG